MDSTFRISVQEQGGKVVATVDGDLALTAYVVRSLKDAMQDGKVYVASIVATTGIGGETAEVVSEITATADAMAYVLNKRMRALRAEANARD